MVQVSGLGTLILQQAPHESVSLATSTDTVSMVCLMTGTVSTRIPGGPETQEKHRGSASTLRMQSGSHHRRLIHTQKTKGRL